MILKVITSMLLAVLIICLIFQFATDKRQRTSIESFVYLGTTMILVMSLICIWI